MQQQCSALCGRLFHQRFGQTPCCCGQRFSLSGRPFFLRSLSLSLLVVQVTKLWENTTVGGQKGLFSSSPLLSVCVYTLTFIYTSHPLNNHKKKKRLGEEGEKRFMVFQRLIAEAAATAVWRLEEEEKEEETAANDHRFISDSHYTTHRTSAANRSSAMEIAKKKRQKYGAGIAAPNNYYPIRLN